VRVRKSIVAVVVAPVLAMVLAAVPAARADECSNAVSDYNSVLARLNDAAQKFTDCVANSLGADACSKEFGKLRSVYGEFQSAVALYRKVCI
jgi:hypothetical protein